VNATGRTLVAASLTSRRGWSRVFPLLRERLGSRSLIVVLSLLVALGLVSVTAALWTPYSPVEESGQALVGPTWGHPFGTDEYGRDILMRVIFGMRLSLLVAVSSAVVAGIVGTLLGLYAGFLRGWRDSLLMRIVDFMLAFPTLVIAMSIVAILGPSTETPTLAAIVVSIPLFARVARASTLSEREKEYVLAARALGAPPFRIMFRTILPAILPVVRVQAAIVAALAVQLEASLSFLGMGVRPPTPSLGAMLQTARGFVYTAPTYGVFPGVFLVLITMALLVVANTLGRQSQVRLDATGVEGE